MMDKNKLHLVACYAASICVDDSYTRCKEALEADTVDELLSDARSEEHTSELQSQ